MIPKPYDVFAMQIGDFGILVRSGFSVSKALFFNFLSALVALAGTALVSINLLACVKILLFLSRLIEPCCVMLCRH